MPLVSQNRSDFPSAAGEVPPRPGQRQLAAGEAAVERASLFRIFGITRIQAVSRTVQALISPGHARRLARA